MSTKETLNIVLLYVITGLMVFAVTAGPAMYSKYKSDDHLHRTGSRMCYMDGSELDLTSERSNKLEPMATIYCK